MRKFETSHPWLRFTIDLRSAPPALWLMLGECTSKSGHISGAPLRPGLAKEMHQIYLAKGIAATTAIEGNTLSEAQILLHLEGRLTVPPSKEYLKQEVENIRLAFNHVLRELRSGHEPTLSQHLIAELNRLVLKDLTLPDSDTNPGALRKHSVGVMDYRGAPAADCAFLVQTMCTWLNGLAIQPGQEIAVAIVKAVLAHLDLAWIHPFGDGNGRTARMVEAYILLAAGTPTPAVHLLSNHYNQTRAEYYRQLSAASKSGGDVLPFLVYAVQGLRDGLREQVERIRNQHWDICWQNYIHNQFKHHGETEADRRQKALMNALSSVPGGVNVEELPRLNAPIAVAYAKLSAKTLQRDLVALEQLQLIRRESGKIIANRERILSFLPMKAKPGG